MTRQRGVAVRITETRHGGYREVLSTPPPLRFCDRIEQVAQSGDGWLQAFNEIITSDDLGWFLEGAIANLIDREGWLESEVIAALLLRTFDEFVIDVSSPELRESLRLATHPALIDYFTAGYNHMGNNLYHTASAKDYPRSERGPLNPDAPDRTLAPFKLTAVLKSGDDEPPVTFVLDYPTLEMTIDGYKYFLESAAGVAFILRESVDQMIRDSKETLISLSVSPDEPDFDKWGYLEEYCQKLWDEGYSYESVSVYS